MINQITPQTLGGGYAGMSPMQTINSQRDSSDVMARRKLRDAVNKPYMTSNGRVLSPFKAVMGYGQFRDNLYYIDGTEPNQVGTTLGGRVFSGLNKGSTIPGGISNGTGGLPSNSGNRQYIANGTEYSDFKRLMAINANYNDIAFGGYNNSSQVAQQAAFYGQVGFM
jgi:hypothetical protein